MKTTQGPARVSALEVPPKAPFDVYRIARSDNPEDPVFLDSLLSHYELSEPPRKIERDWTVIHMGISVYTAHRVAEGTAQRFTVLGDYVARLALRSGLGINFAHTGHPLHLTLWADPVKLAETVVDIRPVDR